MPLTSEQIEVQRGKFESCESIKNSFSFIRHENEYDFNSTQEAFEIWLSAIESVEIELPEKTNEDPYGCCTYSKDISVSIQLQGYKVKS